ncbi:MAG: CfrBI family restriction endonuclease [Gemmatimonadetes bacterium]|nr:CfrBI family restriction endonuclease [Gemmatimonadota bacterium]
MNNKLPANQIQIFDPFAPEGIREAVARILEGHNYRLFFEDVTKRRLIAAYRELAKFKMDDQNDDEKWKEAIIEEITRGDDKNSDKNLKFWLLGLTKKTAQNLGVKKAEYPQLFDRMIHEIQSQSSYLGVRDSALLVWAGAATLTVRGSQKARVGKLLEKGVVRAALTIVGLSESNGDFVLNIMPDQEVDRETDAEVRTRRGTVRIDVAMIGEGNPEVIDDKISRVGRNGVVLFDKLSPNSNAWANGERQNVKMIQMRNSDPVEELRSHLGKLGVGVVPDEIPINDIANKVLAIDPSQFDF